LVRRVQIYKPANLAILKFDIEYCHRDNALEEKQLKQANNLIDKQKIDRQIWLETFYLKAVHWINKKNMRACCDRVCPTSLVYRLTSLGSCLKC